MDLTVPGLARFLSELKRRKVYHVAVAYVVVGVGLLGAAELILDPLGLSTSRPLIVVLVLLGFPIALVLAWAYELRPEDAKPATGSKRGNQEPERTSIVVLPFSNLSTDREDAYFSDGLTEEIITNLAYLRSLRVISRSTAMVLKDAGKDVRTIGRELDVKYVLEGSVRKAGDKLRVTAQLIDARTDEHLWAERHDGTMGDVFEVQERIAKRVAAALRLKLTPIESRRLEERAIDDPKAYDMWVLAMHEGRKFTSAGIERGIQLANEALGIVGDNARLHASLGFLYWGAYDFGVRHEDGTLELAEQAATRALALDPTLPLALHARALVRYKKGDSIGFITHARAAAELGGDSDVLGMLGFVLAEAGRQDEGRRYTDEALEADPLSFLPWFFRSAVDLLDGQPRAALERIRAARNRLAANEPFAGWWVAQMAAYSGEEREAQYEFEKVASMDAGLWTEFSELFRRALANDRTGVIDYLTSSQASTVAQTDEYYPVFLANVLCRIGEHDRALEWLARAVNWGFTNDTFLAEGNRFLEPLWKDERFRNLLALARQKQKAIPGSGNQMRTR
jgi:TolB-like protein